MEELFHTFFMSNLKMLKTLMHVFFIYIITTILYLLRNVRNTTVMRDSDRKGK